MEKTNQSEATGQKTEKTPASTVKKAAPARRTRRPAAVSAAAEPAAAAAPISLDDPSLYINRDISWIEFFSFRFSSTISTNSSWFA